jgi:Flp pilus assembly pilin Flp
MLNKALNVGANKVRSSKLASDNRGGGVVEYVIIIGCIAILAFAGFKAFGGQVKDQITKQTTTLKDVPTDGSAK